MSVNKVILIGRLGQNPELKQIGDGKSVCNFSVATSESWKDKNTGEKQEKTEWSNVVVYGAQAVPCSEYLKKGSKVYLEGKLKTRSWEKENIKHYATEVIASTVQFMDAKEQ